MQKNIRKRKILFPKHIRDLFWEYPKQKLSWQKDLDLIIRRILESGEWESVKWLLITADHLMLRNWILQKRGAGLDARRLRFWQLVLRLPADEVDSWIRINYSNPWHKRWNK